MPKFKVKVTQVSRVERSIVMEVEADTQEEAMDVYESGDAPCSSLPGWTDHWDLQNETVELV